MHYKELVHIITETEKYHALQWAGWRPRRASAVSSRRKARRLETQEELVFPFESRGRKKTKGQIKALRREEFPFTHQRVRLWLYAFN